LNGILAISEALFQEIGNKPEYLPYLQHIRNQVGRLSALMRDLLDLGKPLVQSEFVPNSVEKLVRGAIESFRFSSHHGDCTVNFIFSPRSASYRIKADAMKIQQVIMNLLDNACDHTPDKEPVAIELTDQEDSYAVIRIIDRGSGIPPEKLQDVLKPFYTTRKSGTGLGLSIVKHIVSIHDGTLSLANNVPPPGLTAEIRLPLIHE
jgi:signal transduction histidine kinase